MASTGVAKLFFMDDSLLRVHIYIYGISRKPIMLDEALIKFVEPIGPGQIVDRESLVALPAGRIQMTIEVNEAEINVRVLSMKEERFFNGDTALSNWQANAFIWQNGQVIAAEKSENRLEKARSRPTRSRTLPRMPNVSRRRTRITPRTFRFMREPSDNIEDTTVVDAILQICLYKYQNGGVQKKLIVGTVHVALNYLTSQKSQSLLNQNLACDGDWFKVFPRSSFLPGCPSSIAKVSCVISGVNSSSNEDLAESELNITRSLSSVSIKHVTLRRSQSQISSVSNPQSSDSPRSRIKTDPNPKVTHRIATWVRETVFRQSSVPTEATGKARTPEEAPSDDVFTMPPVLIGPRIKHIDKTVMSAIPETQDNEEQLSSPSSTSNTTDQLPVPDQSRLNIAKNKMAKFRTSRSNNSSFDVGYESGRSRYLSSSDEELSYKSAESNLDVLCEKEAEIEAVAQKQPDSEWFEMEIVNEKGKVMPAKRKKPLSLKQRQCTLQRSARISCDDMFTSLNEMQRRPSRGSQDSAIYANA